MSKWLKIKIVEVGDTDRFIKWVEAGTPNTLPEYTRKTGVGRPRKLPLDLIEQEESEE